MLSLADRDYVDEKTTTYGYPIEDVKSAATEPLNELTKGIMDRIEEDLTGLTEDPEDMIDKDEP